MSKLVKFVYRILCIMILLLLVYMVIKVIENDVLFSIRNLLKFSIVGVGIFLIYKIPFSFVIDKAKRENRTLSSDMIKDVLLVNFMLFALFGTVFFIFNFLFISDYWYYSFYCLIISLQCRNMINKTSDIY